MEEFINSINIFSGDQVSSQENREASIPHVERKGSNNSMEVPVKFKTDIDTLLRVYGSEVKAGATITMTLRDALEVLPRDRKRTDAYSSLSDWLKKHLDFTFIVKSQKTKTK